jgi:hypothetical protein
MAGSLKWCTYTDDAGTDWAIFVDESNFENANSNIGVGAPLNQVLKPPSNMRPRYAVYSNQAGTRTVRVPITNQAIYNALDSADSIPDQIAGGGAVLNLIRKRSEQIGPIPTIFDTGLDDGDNP